MLQTPFSLEGWSTGFRGARLSGQRPPGPILTASRYSDGQLLHSGMLQRPYPAVKGKVDPCFSLGPIGPPEALRVASPSLILHFRRIGRRVAASPRHGSRRSPRRARPDHRPPVGFRQATSVLFPSNTKENPRYAEAHLGYDVGDPSRLHTG
jgi:hypothetical protein